MDIKKSPVSFSLARIAREAIWVAVWTLFFCRLTPAQISPGPLSHAHQQLEGVAKCASCHDFGAGPRGFKCLECHAEIRRRVEAHAGYHSRVYRVSPSQTDCARCHMEHNGQGFVLTRLERKDFDHAAQTGFVLEGKHRAQSCEKCHTAKHIPASARAEIKMIDPGRSFLGLRRECTSCHEDVHRGQLGAECTRCHRQEGWRPAPGFSHASTSFPLTGLHQMVACDKCHAPHSGEKTSAEKASGEKTVLFKGLAASSCQSCHMDPHKGAFQEAKVRGSCDTCHTTAGWKNIHLNVGFTHNDTKFPLQGKHADLTCAKCHKDTDFKRPVKHERCADCHEDPHKGQFVSRVAGSDCSACHNQTSYKPTLFDRETHRRSAFPLEGKHEPLPCENCHPPAGKDTVYMTRKLTCTACHADRHGGEFASAPYLNTCDLCHNVGGFQPSTFSAARHAQTKFALPGPHAYLPCYDCHKPVMAALAAVPLYSASNFLSGPLRQYHFAAQTCNTCHADPHQTRLACETCHAPQRWNDLRPFDHATTKFQLEGAHTTASCLQCHIPGDGTNAPVFPETPGQCFRCHVAKDVHGGQFRTAAREEDCSSCHVTARWDTKDFNHERAAFPLDVAHRSVACEKCHKEQRQIAGKMVRMYRGTPTECVRCH